MNISIPKISGKDILSDFPNISKKTLQESAKSFKKYKRLAYANSGVWAGNSILSLSMGKNAFMVAGGILSAVIAIYSLYINKGISNLHKATEEAYKLKTNA